MFHERFIYPVGQGGFACEIIDGYVVVFDCGSISSPQMVASCVDNLAQHTNHVDLLFISHFDKDHVNTLSYLLSVVQVKTAVTSMIPKELKWCYGVYTNGAYTTIMQLLEEKGVETEEVGKDEANGKTYHFHHIWEWIAKSMMTQTDFNGLKVQLQAAGIDLGQVENPVYVEKNKEVINKAFKIHFGAKGPNAKGLIMLSQHCKDVKVKRSEILNGCGIGCLSYNMVHESDVSSCLYVGDADLKKRGNVRMLRAFIDVNRTEKPLLLMQIPHHGSKYNVGARFETDFPAKFYYVNDEDTRRLQKNVKLFVSLTSQKKLMVSRALCQDLISTVARI